MSQLPSERPVYREQCDLISINRPHKTESVTEDDADSCQHAVCKAAASVELDFQLMPRSLRPLRLSSRCRKKSQMASFISVSVKYKPLLRVTSPKATAKLNLNPILALKTSLTSTSCSQKMSHFAGKMHIKILTV